MDYNDLYINEKFEEFKNKINRYIELDSTNKAIKILEEAHKQCPDHPGINYILGLAYYKSNDIQLAYKYAKEALTLDENESDYSVLIAKICYELGNNEEANRFAISEFKKNKENIDILIILSKLALKRNSINEAIEIAEKAVSIAPNSYDAIRTLSLCYIELGDNYKLILDTLKRAKKLGQDNQIDLDIISVLFRNKQYDDCMKECRKLINRNPNSLESQEARKIVNQIRTQKLEDNYYKSDNNKDSNETSYNHNNSENTNYQNYKYDDKKNEYKTGESTWSTNKSTLEASLKKLNDLTGLDSVKKEINDIVSVVNYEKIRNQRLGIKQKNDQTYHFMFTGNPGTGKTTVARILGEIFCHLGIIDKPDVIEVDRGEIVGQFIGQTAILTKEAIAKAMGGVLFIDEAYTLAKGGENDFGREAIDTLLKAMEDNRGKFIVILAGYKNDMRELMKLNPGLASRITIPIHFEDYTDTELLTIAKNSLTKQQYELSEDGEKAFLQLLNKEKVDENFGNARTVRNIIEKTLRNKATKIGNNIVSTKVLSSITALDLGIDLSITPEQRIAELKSELDNMIGLDSAKQVIDKIIGFVNLQEKRRELNLEVEPMSLHMAFEGNPGTGKTTMARLIGRILKELGILKKGHIVEVTRADLVADVIGKTATKTLDKIKEAYGGILFIDEAYSLCPAGSSSNDFGKEAIDTLIKEMEDNRDKLVVIMAGYTDDMKKLLDINPGITSRIKWIVPFDDYNAKELSQIFENMCTHNGYILEESANNKAYERFKEECLSKDKNFGNGRLVRNVFEEVKINLSMRISQKLDLTKADIITITPEDISLTTSVKQKELEEYESLTKEQKINLVRQELNSLIGLEEAKEIINKIISFVDVQEKRKSLGLSTESMTLHMVFEGNPGTGKTTVARLVGKIFKELGVLREGHVTEVTRADLVGEYVGQTAQKTLSKIKEAYGGILFIDEAYSLCSVGASSNDFGKEAIETLIKEMEDNRDKLIVIMAGYTEEMNNLLNINPGIRSRIKWNIRFEDYNTNQLIDIFKSIVIREGYELNRYAEARVYEKLMKEYNLRNKNFGNGRLSRNIFEEVKLNQSVRVSEKAEVTKEDLITIMPQDIIL